MVSHTPHNPSLFSPEVTTATGTVFTEPTETGDPLPPEFMTVESTPNPDLTLVKSTDSNSTHVKSV